MVQKNITVVKIAGREYTIRSVESQEYIHRVAIYVNNKIEEVEKRQPNLSTHMVVMLTAINLADEVLKLKDKVVKLQRELSAVHSLLDEDDDVSVPSNVYDVSRRAQR